MSNRADTLLSRIRYLIGGDLTERGYGELIDTFTRLDAHLSAGGDPPEAWREGPDVPPMHLPGATVDEPIVPGRVYRLVIASEDIDRYGPAAHTLHAVQHSGQDVLVVRAGGGNVHTVESLDGATFPVRSDELYDGATTPADLFAGNQS